MAKLCDLLTKDELIKIKEGNDIFFDINPEIDFRHMSIQQLSDIAFILIKTEYEYDLVPECVLSAKAIEILTNRAIDRRQAIF